MGKRGGARPGAGRPRKNAPRPPKPVKPARIQFRPRADFQRQMQARTLVDPVEIMHDNMVYFHEQAGQILATIMEMPVGPDVTPDRLEALLKFADHNRMRLQSQECARDLAKYTARPLAPKPFVPGEDKPKDAETLELPAVPVHEKALAAFRRAGEGLPPEPRKVL